MFLNRYTVRAYRNYICFLVFLLNSTQNLKQQKTVRFFICFQHRWPVVCHWGAKINYESISQRKCFFYSFVSFSTQVIKIPIKLWSFFFFALSQHFGLIYYDFCNQQAQYINPKTINSSSLFAYGIAADWNHIGFKCR